MTSTVRTARPAAPGLLRRHGGSLLLAAGVLLWCLGFHQVLSLEALFRHGDELAGFAHSHPVLAALALTLADVGMIALSIPGSVLLTILSGFLFGAWLGTGLAVLAATLGASAMYGLAHTPLGAGLVRRLRGRADAPLRRLEHGLRRDAFSCLLALRLVPFVPFWLVNIGAAVLHVPYRDFATATLLGIVPGTAVFAGIGTGLDGVLADETARYHACLSAGQAGCRLSIHLANLVSPAILAGLTGLAVLSLLPVLLRRFRQQPARRRGHA